jgi:hypothetical protein
VFELSEAQRLYLIVRGPAPSCEVAGVIPVRGRKGPNRVDFAGRAGGRNLVPGGYVLSLSLVRRPSADGPTTFVEVISRQRSVPGRPGSRRPNCAAVGVFDARPFIPPLRQEGGPAPAGRGNADKAAPPASTDQQHDVLGAAAPGAGLDAGDSREWLAALVTIGILTLIGAVLLSAVALVTRFLRGTWNP